MLGRLRRVPAAAEAMLLMDQLGSGRQLGAAARSVLVALRAVPAQVVPVLDAVLGWVAVETRGFRPEVVDGQPELRMRVVDVLLVAAAAAPLAALVG